MRDAPAGSSGRCCLLSEPALGPPIVAFDDRLLDDDGLAATTGATIRSVDAGVVAVGAAAVTGAAEPTSISEPVVLDCAPPLLCANPLRGSSVTVDPIDVVAVIPVELLDADPEVDAPAGGPLDAGPSEPAPPVPEGVVPVTEVSPVRVASSVDDVADESVADDSESVPSANATPGVVAIAMPTPNATANPPTRPM